MRTFTFFWLSNVFLRLPFHVKNPIPANSDQPAKVLEKHMEIDQGE